MAAPTSAAAAAAASAAAVVIDPRAGGKHKLADAKDTDAADAVVDENDRAGKRQRRDGDKDVVAITRPWSDRRLREEFMRLVEAEGAPPVGDDDDTGADKSKDNADDIRAVIRCQPHFQAIIKSMEDSNNPNRGPDRVIQFMKTLDDTRDLDINALFRYICSHSTVSWARNLVLLSYLLRLHVALGGVVALPRQGQAHHHFVLWAYFLAGRRINVDYDNAAGVHAMSRAWRVFGGFVFCPCDKEEMARKMARVAGPLAFTREEDGKSLVFENEVSENDSLAGGLHVFGRKDLPFGLPYLMYERYVRWRKSIPRGETPRDAAIAVVPATILWIYITDTRHLVRAAMVSAGVPAKELSSLVIDYVNEVDAIQGADLSWLSSELDNDPQTVAPQSPMSDDDA